VYLIKKIKVQKVALFTQTHLPVPTNCSLNLFCFCQSIKTNKLRKNNYLTFTTEHSEWMDAVLRSKSCAVERYSDKRRTSPALPGCRNIPTCSMPVRAI